MTAPATVKPKQLQPKPMSLEKQEEQRQQKASKQQQIKDKDAAFEQAWQEKKELEAIKELDDKERRNDAFSKGFNDLIYTKSLNGYDAMWDAPNGGYCSDHLVDVYEKDGPEGSLANMKSMLKDMNESPDHYTTLAEEQERFGQGYVPPERKHSPESVNAMLDDTMAVATQEDLKEMASELDKIEADRTKKEQEWQKQNPEKELPEREQWSTDLINEHPTMVSYREQEAQKAQGQQQEAEAEKPALQRTGVDAPPMEQGLQAPTYGNKVGAMAPSADSMPTTPDMDYSADY